MNINKYNFTCKLHAYADIQKQLSYLFIIHFFWKHYGRPNITLWESSVTSIACSCILQVLDVCVLRFFLQSCHLFFFLRINLKEFPFPILFMLLKTSLLKSQWYYLSIFSEQHAIKQKLCVRGCTLGCKEIIVFEVVTHDFNWKSWQYYKALQKLCRSNIIHLLLVILSVAR